MGSRESPGSHGWALVTPWALDDTLACTPSHMSLRVRLGNKRKPAGWELVEDTLYQFEERLREAVDDPHEGKRKCEANWPIHRIHYERNRFIYDMYYKQQRITREL